MKHTWKLSSFDTFCLGMNIKSAWIYKEAPDLEKMKSALESLASMYPHLSGRFDEKEKSVVWDDSAKPELPFDTLDLRKYSISQLSGNARLAWSLVKSYDVKGFKKGNAPAFSATLGYLKDGCILYVQCAHATMDAHAFYSLIAQWAAIYKGEEPSVMTVDQTLLPSEETYSKEETLRLVQQHEWSLIGLKKVIKMLVGLVRNNSIKNTTVIEVPQDVISRLKTESGAGTNAVLSAIVVKKMAERLPGKKTFKMLFTTDLRGRFNGIGDDFFGNLSQPAVIKDAISKEGDTASIAAAVGRSLKDALVSDALEENVRLYMCSSHYGLPYAPFDASDMNCPGNGTVIINNFLKFRANALNWGTGLPLYTFTNELPDMVKIWQPAAGGPVQIIFGGYAAKMMEDFDHETL
ncbi:MAG: acyltransferase [Bacteroidia bacterium]|nr:acyltransferase [Bacteroidia bacterium]